MSTGLFKPLMRFVSFFTAGIGTAMKARLPSSISANIGKVSGPVPTATRLISETPRKTSTVSVIPKG